jgi:hypothetical protein
VLLAQAVKGWQRLAVYCMYILLQNDSQASGYDAVDFLKKGVFMWPSFVYGWWCMLRVSEITE